MIKKILNKVFYAVVIALVFAFINRGCAKALGDPFYTTGTLDFNIITKDSDNQYFVAEQTRNYDFSLLLEEHSSDFDNYRYFFITLTAIYNNSWGTNHYVVELYFSNDARSQYGYYSDTFTGNFQRYVYDTNYVFKSNAIFDASNTLTATQQIQSSTRTGIMAYAYYKRVPFYGMFESNMNIFPNNSSYMNTDNFLDPTNIPLLNTSYSSPVYYIPIGTYTTGARCLLFSNYSGIVAAYSSISGANTIDYNYEYYIGEPINEPDYDIQFSIIDSSNNSQELYNNDNTITGAGIAVKYLPFDNDLFDYYYYWEDDIGESPVGPPNSFSDWNKVLPSEKGISAMSVDSNGWLYASIAEKNSSSSSYSKTLHYTRVGSISLIPVSNNKVSTWLDKFSQNINYGGPISSILTIPINLVSALYNGFGGTCHSFNMGAILGQNITFNCFTLQSILGSDITNVIDMICSFVIYYHLILFIISIYRKIMNLEELDDYMPQHLYHPKHGSYEDYNE